MIRIHVWLGLIVMCDPTTNLLLLHLHLLLSDTSLAGVLMKTLEAAAEDKTWLLIKSNYQMFVRLCPGSTVGGWRAVKTKILSPKLYPAYHYGLSREGPPLCRLQPALLDSVNQWPANCKASYWPFFLLKLILLFCRVTRTRQVTSLRT